MRPVTVHQARHGPIWGAVPMPDGSAGTGPAEAFTAPDPLAGEDRLHVVFGTGQVGRVLAAVLAGRGLNVRVVSRHRPSALADGIDWREADATDLDAAADAAKGASVVYQCVNAPYTQWPELFPPLQRGVLTAAERTGALLVALENLYGYGPTGGRPMTEDLPLAATGVKGRTRAAMTAELLAAADAGRVRIAIGRASDFFGAGVTQGSTLGERVFGNALAGRRADFIGHPDLPHTYSYVPDIAVGLATLGTDARAAGQVWHLPGPATGTTRELLDLVAAEVGHPVGVRSVPKIAMRALGLVNPMLRELAEMSYEFDEPFVLDTSKYQSTFGVAGTPLAAAVAATVAWYRTRPGTP
jgi:nucleoside-diphosphate-sugar epimerase